LKPAKPDFQKDCGNVRYWWVNQNQTYRQEIDGGYLWSPKRNANGARNPFYEFMREVAPGDLVFSFVDTRIVAIGTVASYCYESPKPTEFGGVGLNWEAIGWRVRVNFVSLLNKIRPKDHIDLLRRVLPSRLFALAGLREWNSIGLSDRGAYAFSGRTHRLDWQGGGGIE
jgi:hypothetical protein